MIALPFVTPDLPGTGGIAKVVPEDFRVDEVPAYLPCGEGEHTYLHVEKRGRNTREVVEDLARMLHVSAREAGVAGQKDRHALTTQWVSFPGVDPAKAEGLEGPGFRVLAAKRHGNKLRTGHLRGNRFELRLRGVGPEALARARAVGDALAVRGLPNFYGPQRFGRFGDNAEVGRLLLLGADDPRVRRVRDRTQRRFLISAFQSDVFNRVLAARVADGSWTHPLVGDVLQKLPAGGLFVCEDPAADDPRVASFELSITGPMPGRKVRPAPGGAPAELEERMLAETGVGAEHLARTADAEGARRVMRLPLALDAREDAEGLVLSFELPPGAYATVVLREITKGELPAGLEA